ncbi:MAG: hypothetical protein JO345_34560 [Streptosporangiaceae bacterium]|nr:hypothetical protein [Streptosporangiaceae bacterium]
MAEQTKYLFENPRIPEETFGPDLNERLNTRAAEGWELVSSQLIERPRYRMVTVALIWRRSAASLSGPP